MQLDLVGAVKIKDGLFIGDEIAAQDLEFIVMNKVQNIINVAGRQIINHWESIGVKYFTLNWTERANQQICDRKALVVGKISHHVNQALKSGQSVLIHSVRGKNRCACATAMYLMRKYKWSASKAIQFILSRKQDIEISQSFWKQLEKNQAIIVGSENFTYNWDQLYGEATIDSQELVLRNTYLNTQQQQENGDMIFSYADDQKNHDIRVNWADDGTDNAEKLVNVKHLSSKNPVEGGFAILQSCIKGGSKTEQKYPIQRFPIENNYKAISLQNKHQGHQQSNENLKLIGELMPKQSISNRKQPAKRRALSAGKRQNAKGFSNTLPRERIESGKRKTGKRGKVNTRKF